MNSSAPGARLVSVFVGQSKQVEVQRGAARRLRESATLRACRGLSPLHWQRTDDRIARRYERMAPMPVVGIRRAVVGLPWSKRLMHLSHPEPRHYDC